MSRQISERQQWFLDHIGKTIYRNDNGCDCAICQAVKNNGLFVQDEMQAIYCYDIECDYTNEGNPLKYFDTATEALEFSIQQKK